MSGECTIIVPRLQLSDLFSICCFICYLEVVSNIPKLSKRQSQVRGTANFLISLVSLELLTADDYSTLMQLKKI